MIHNPIIPGNYPDPSICRAGDDFYLICSSFEEYPGIPIFHSRDLANWEQIGHAMTTGNGFEVDSSQQGGGVMAPTIRYNKGTFYIINDNCSHRGNFIVSAKDPRGPWSSPHFLPDVKDIDASLFFDDDGKCYVIGVNTNEKGRTTGIWAQELDLEKFCTTGERHDIWDAALRPVSDPEAPHIYKKDGWYYLLIAEGGTGFYHSATIARAKNIFDWYEGNPANPIITHRHLGSNASITNIGHADFVELPDGSWYAVMLGSRNYNGYKPYGRESFICPMVWERGWPVLSPETGKMEFEYPAPECLPWTPYPEQPAKDDFDGSELRKYWTFSGADYQDFWKLADSQLKLRCLPRSIDRLPRPVKKPAAEVKEPVRDDCISLILRHQTRKDFTITTRMFFCPEAAEAAGMFIGSGLNSHIRLEVFQYNGRRYLSCKSFQVSSNSMWFDSDVLAKVTMEEHARSEWNDDSIVLQIRVSDRKYHFSFGTDEEHLQLLSESNSPDGIMGGVIFGLFASANGGDSSNEASFDYFTYE